MVACGLRIEGELSMDAADGATDTMASPDGAGETSVTDGEVDADLDSTASDSADGAIPPKTTVVVSAGSIAAATGLAQQKHLIYAVGSARWWLFYIDSTDVLSLKTATSADFSTWTSGGTLTLPQPHGGDAQSFSVDYASIAGQDVVHLTFSHRLAANDRRRYHTRARISASTITFGTPAMINSTTDLPASLDPDGTATLIGQDQRIVDLSGWTNVAGSGNAVAWQSSSLDLGASWAPGFGAQQAIGPAATAAVNARALVGLASSQVLTLWELADTEPDPTNIMSSRWNGALWTAPANVFVAAAQNANDWALCRVSDTDIHAVRRISSGAYEHRHYDGATWGAGQAIAAQPGIAGGGVVLLQTMTGLTLVTIASDAASTVRQTRWAAAAWSAWSTVEGSTATRTHLEGYGAPAMGKLAVIWTQANGASFDVVASPVAP